MSWIRLVAACGLSIGFGVVSQPVRAADPPPPASDAPATPTEAPKKKDPFFGDHFAMYLETRGGPATIDSIDNSLQTGFKSDSVNELNFSGSKSGQFTVGWTLPRGRGQYLLTYTGFSDGTLELDATGSQATYQAAGGQQSVPIGYQLPWWHLSIRDGQMTTTKAPPVWNSNTPEDGGDDANDNNLPDPNEIRYLPATVNVTTTVPKSLGNSVQTWDLYYRREFGGVRIRSRWTAGIRYLSYEGAVVTPFWATGAQSTDGFGFSDGSVIDLMIVKQSTSGWGPVGSGEIQFNFFRQRLTLYAMVQAAFLLETLDADSGTFAYFTRDDVQPVYFPGAGHVDESLSKSAWNTTFEAGVRFRVLEGFHIFLDWNTTGYLDTMLLPTDLSLPDVTSQIALGTTARFVSRDFVVSTVNFGLSFQF